LEIGSLDFVLLLRSIMARGRRQGRSVQLFAVSFERPAFGYALTRIGTSSGVHLELPKELTTSSAVNVPTTSARFTTVSCAYQLFC